jgi:NAD(P)-dependent dehydrogenase (short-subunit alcohol dehydrogenase family)
MKRILITGANRGVGFGLAEGYAARGDRVFAGCRSTNRATELDELASNFPGQVTILPLDVADEESIAKSAAIVAEKSAAIDILFNNAAIGSSGENVKTFQAEKALHILHVNSVGQIQVTKHFIDLVKEGTGPVIVNISSEAGSITNMTTFRGYYYSASKSALNMFTRALAADPETEGITVIALHPGWVRTDMGGPDAHISVTESAAGIIMVVAELTPEDNGHFYTWEGNEVPW